MGWCVGLGDVDDVDSSMLVDVYHVNVTVDLLIRVDVIVTDVTVTKRRISEATVWALVVVVCTQI